ncbi:MAG: glutamate-cysteine ligase family protein [Streptosporangiaceae bacterium]
MTVRDVGVEEELMLVDPASGQARAVAGAVIRAAEEAAAASSPEGGSRGEPSEALEFEFKLEQLETGTRPCASLEELGREVRRCRSLAADAGRRVGVQVNS